VNLIGKARADLRPLRDEFFFPVCSPELANSGRLDHVPLFDTSSMTASWNAWHGSKFRGPPSNPVNFSSTLVVPRLQRSMAWVRLHRIPVCSKPPRLPDNSFAPTTIKSRRKSVTSLASYTTTNKLQPAVPFWNGWMSKSVPDALRLETFIIPSDKLP